MKNTQNPITLKQPLQAFGHFLPIFLFMHVGFVITVIILLTNIIKFSQATLHQNNFPTVMCSSDKNSVYLKNKNTKLQINK